MYYSTTSARHAATQVRIPRGRRRTAEPADWRSDARASVRPSVVSTTFQPPLDGRPWPVSVYLLRRSRAPKNSSRIDAVGGGGRGAKGNACVRPCATAGGACACARVPARPATTRPPNSDLVRSPHRVTRIPPAGRLRPRNRTVRQRVRRRALRECSPIGIRRYIFYCNQS